MQVVLIPRYEDNKTYPIIVKFSCGGCRIVEMLGRIANEWNDKLCLSSSVETQRIGVAIQSTKY